MQMVQIQAWLLTMLLTCPVMIYCIRPMERNSIQNNDYECRRSFNNILSDLRNNWQSPISYLQTRGYIPPREQTFNIKFRARDERLKGAGSKLDSNQKAASGFNRDELQKDTNSNSDKNTRPDTIDNNSADNDMNTNGDTSANNNNNLNTNLNTKLNNNLNTNLDSNLNTKSLRNNLNNDLNSKSLHNNLNSDHKMDTFPTANAIARLNAETMSSNGNLNGSPNLINELNTNANLNSYADLSNDLNQPPTVQNNVKNDEKNSNFLHSVKNKFIGFFRGKPDAKGPNRKSAFTYDNYNDFSDPIPKELVMGDTKQQDISNLYGKATDPEIERIIQRGLKKDNEYDKEFISSNKDLLSKLGKYV